MNPDWIDDYVMVERYLLERACPKLNRPAQLDIDADDPPDADKWAFICRCLNEKGWRIAADGEGELWFFAPGPLTDPGDEARLNN